MREMTDGWVSQPTEEAVAADRRARLPAVNGRPMEALRALGLDAALLDVISGRVLEPG